MRIQLESLTAEWTPKLGPHYAILLMDPYDLGPGTSHLKVPWVWQIPSRWVGLIGAHGEGKNLNMQITPWLLPVTPCQLVVQNPSDQTLRVWSIIIPPP